MDKLIITETSLLSKLPTPAGKKGELLVIQDSVGGHLLQLGDDDEGTVDLVTVPHGATILHWYKDDVKTYWSSKKLTPETLPPVPSTINNFASVLVDTVSVKLRWTAPQGEAGDNFTKADVYRVIISTSDITTTNIESLGQNIPIQPKLPGTIEEYILPALESNTRYYIAIFSQRSFFGKTRTSLLSNVISIFTTPLVSTVPIRIPLLEDNIWEGTVGIGYDEGQQLIDYPNFRRLAHQDSVVDNNGVPEGLPSVRVTAFDTYSSHQLEWYNVGKHKVCFDLGAEYNLAYIYYATDNNDNFTIETSFDGVTLIPAYSGGGFVSGWRKLTLNSNSKQNIRYIYLGLGKTSGNIFGFLPYGTKLTTSGISGEKYKRQLNQKTYNESIGTNLLLAETQPEWIGQVSSIGRVYVESDWLMNGVWRNTGAATGKTHQDIQMRVNVPGLWNWDDGFKALLDNGQSSLCLTLVRSFAFLRTAIEAPSAGNNYKPVDPGLNFKDFSVTTNPQSYKWFSALMNSIVYRWGNNPDANDSYNRFYPSDGKKALNYLKAVEWGNENEKHWETEERYYHPFEAAAIMSALYDGHKGALGAGYGIKSVDPNMKLIMAGMYSPNTAYIKFMTLWWDANRGKGDYPIDVFNFHHYNTYTSKPNTYTGSIYSWGLKTPSIAYGVEPERGFLIEDTEIMNRFRSLYAQNKEVICTEWGYGEQFRGSTSPQDSDRYKRGEHKAVWLLRTSMIYLALGLDYMNHYWYAGGSINVDDLNENKPGAINKEITAEAFYTVGLVEGVSWAGDWVRKKSLAAWWYVVAFRNAMEGYKFSHIVMEKGHSMVQESIVNSFNPNLWAMAFTNSTTGKSIIVMWMGVDDWSSTLVNVSLANNAITVPITNFEEQYLREEETGVTNIVIPAIASGLKSINVNVTETPLIIETSLIGTPILLEPINVKSEKINETSIKVVWTDRNIGTNKARIFISTDPVTGFVIHEEVYRDTAETTITGLTQNLTYYFKVQFVDDARLSAVSETTSSKTARFIVPPTDLNQISATSSTILLGWSYSVPNEANITHYILYRSSTINGEYVEVARVLASLRSYRDFGLVPSSQYYYKIKGYNDGSESVFSFSGAGTTGQPSYIPPTVLSVDTNTLGSTIELYFDEELKDEQTAINAFSIVENFSGMTIFHPVTSISIPTNNKTKVVLGFDIPFFKNSQISLSYSAASGSLKSLYNYAVNTFANYTVTNNVLTALSPVLDFTEIYSMTIAGNTITSLSSGARAVGQVKILAGQSSIVQWNVQDTNDIILGLSTSDSAEGFSTMPYYTRKYIGKQEWKEGSSSGLSVESFTKGLMRFRTNLTNVFYEHSTDFGVTWITVHTADRIAGDLHVKFFADGTGQQVVNLVGFNLEGTSNLIIPEPPTDMTVDDTINSVGFTLNPGYSLADHEYCTNYSSFVPVWRPIISNPISVGDINIAVGDLGIRVKAGTDRAASTAIVNTVALTGSINSDSPIMVQPTNGGAVLFGCNTYEELDTWLSTATITEALTVQFNTSDVYMSDVLFQPTYNNGSNWITFQSAAGQRATFDGMNANASVLRLNRNYTIWKNVRLANADINNSGGCIIRGDLRKHIKLLDIIYDYGFCGVRATEQIEDWEIDGAIVRNTIAGSFRINSANNGNSLATGNADGTSGNPSAIPGDVEIPDANMRIRNVFLDDVTGGGIIPGTTDNSRFSGSFVLKYTNNYTIENVRPLSGDRLYDLGTLEVCNSVKLRRIYADRLFSQGCDGLEYKNCYLPGTAFGFSDLGDSQNISMYHSLINSSFYNIGKLLQLRGNIFPGGLSGNLLSPSDIPDVETDNIFEENIAGRYIDFGTTSGPNYIVSTSNLSTYLASGKGVNSLYIAADATTQLNRNPYGSLRGDSAGKNRITAVIAGISDDVYGVNRAYPTDPGPFSGLRPDANDVPIPPTATGDNLARTLVFSHALGASEIVYNINGGVFIPYTGVIDVGPTALSANYYTAKIKAASYRDESAVVGSPSYTDAPDVGDYTVLRTMEINFRGEYGSSSTDANINEYHPDGSNPIDGTTISVALIETDGTASSITISAFESGFVGSTSDALPTGDYFRSENAMRTALELNNGAPIAKLKLTGLDDTKFYQFYIVSCSQYSGHQNKFTVGSTFVIKDTGLSYPYAADGDLHSNPAIAKIDDQVSVDGELVLEIEKTGSGWQGTAINYLVIEETNEAKPA